jgi:hypothetical protein
VLSAILWLGNLSYRGGDNDKECLNDAAVLLDSDTTILRTIASLLQIDYNQLIQVNFFGVILRIYGLFRLFSMKSSFICVQEF